MAKANGKDALNHAIQAAELYMVAASKASDKAQAARLRRKCQELIAYAEKVKAQLSNDSASVSSDILRESSRLHDNEFPPWVEDPSDDEFMLSSGRKLYE